MKLKTLLATGALLCATTQALAMSASQERQFLDENHVKDRIATITAPEHTFITVQGGNSGKACDNPNVAANTMTQVSSDNDISPGGGGTWEATGGGFVTLQNTGRKPALCTADMFFGDQSQGGATLGNYFHLQPVTWKLVLPNTGEQVNWHLLDTVPLLQDHEGDAMAYWVFLTCSQPVKCILNAYNTLEFQQ